EQRNRASFPTSFGSPHAPIGTFERTRALSPGSAIKDVFKSVANGPGLMATTVIFSAASSSASARVKPSKPALLAEYAVLPGKETWLNVEVMLIIRPYPWPRMSGTKE